MRSLVNFTSHLVESYLCKTYLINSNGRKLNHSPLLPIFWSNCITLGRTPLITSHSSSSIYSSRHKGSRSFSKRLKNNRVLYEAISSISKKPFVVDSSKRHNRYLALKADKYNQIKLVIIVRSLEGVVNSYLKRGVKDIEKICQSYLRYYNLKTLSIIKSLGEKEYLIYPLN